MENILAIVGENIKECRTVRRLSRRALGELVGISGQAIWKIETGRSDPKLTNLNKIAEALDTRVENLVTPLNDIGMLEQALAVLGQVRQLSEHMDGLHAEIIRRGLEHDVVQRERAKAD